MEGIFYDKSIGNKFYEIGTLGMSDDIEKMKTHENIFK